MQENQNFLNFQEGIVFLAITFFFFFLWGGKGGGMGTTYFILRYISLAHGFQEGHKAPCKLGFG